MGRMDGQMSKSADFLMLARSPTNPTSLRPNVSRPFSYIDTIKTHGSHQKLAKSFKIHNELNLSLSCCSSFSYTHFDMIVQVLRIIFLVNNCTTSPAMGTVSHDISLTPCTNCNYTSFFHYLPQDRTNNINHHCI